MNKKSALVWIKANKNTNFTIELKWQIHAPIAEAYLKPFVYSIAIGKLWINIKDQKKWMPQQNEFNELNL